MQDANAATPLNDIFSSNNNNSHDIGDMNVGDQAYCPLSDNEIISAARKFRILVKSLSSPVKKKVHTYICSYANKLVMCVCACVL